MIKILVLISVYVEKEKYLLTMLMSHRVEVSLLHYCIQSILTRRVGMMML